MMNINHSSYSQRNSNYPKKSGNYNLKRAVLFLLTALLFLISFILLGMHDLVEASKLLTNIVKFFCEPWILPGDSISTKHDIFDASQKIKTIANLFGYPDPTMISDHGVLSYPSPWLIAIIIICCSMYWFISYYLDIIAYYDISGVYTADDEYNPKIFKFIYFLIIFWCVLFWFIGGPNIEVFTNIFNNYDFLINYNFEIYNLDFRSFFSSIFSTPTPDVPAPAPYIPPKENTPEKPSCFGMLFLFFLKGPMGLGPF